MLGIRNFWTVAALCAAMGCSHGSKPSTEAAAPGTDPDLQARIDQFTVAELTADVGHLPPNERQALDKLVEAAALLDPIFDRQVYVGNPALAATLERDPTPEGKARAAYFRIMRGPWDRQDHHRPFAIERARPPGAGFYPEGLTAEELETYIARHPEKKEELTSLVTVVVLEGDDLVGIPYSKAYAEWLVPAAAKLREAAALTSNASLKRFLELRAQAFLDDDYYESDKAWMDLDSPVEVTIGPYETYEDERMGLKGSFEAFVTVADPDASAKLARFKAMLPEMEKNLPIPDAMKTVRGAESPIRVVDLVFSSGDARKSVQTIAFNLPNDERVRKEKGAKKVLLRNLIMTKFDRIMRPIAGHVLTADQLPLLSSDAFFHEVLFHELSHSLGPAFTSRSGEPVEVRVALGAMFSPLEEAKADVMGAYNILYLIDRGEFPKEMRQQLLVSYFAGLFRSVRFGVAEAHGQAAALQINRFLEEGAATFDPESKKFHVDLAKLEVSISNLVRDICVLQHEGDKAGVEALLAKYGVMSPPMEAALGSLGDVPVDVFPIYPLAGEKQ